MQRGPDSDTFSHSFQQIRCPRYRIDILFISIASFLFFWLHRAHVYSGDGGLIARITEGGKWVVKNELFAQTIVQSVYQLLRPWHIQPIEVMNLLSCISGTIALVLLTRFGKGYRVSAGWTIALFFSSGFLSFACGRTEYYPLVLPAMIAYGILAVQYIENRVSFTSVWLLFFGTCTLHFAMLMAFPSLLILPWLKNQKKDYSQFLSLALAFIPLLIIRNYPQWIGFKAASFSPAWNVLPWFPYEGMPRHYAFWQWDHLWDWLYAWTMRSWLFWPLVVWGIKISGLASITRKDRIFLFCYAIPFTLWTTIWHPDLAIPNDWDLFALEAVPVFLLVITYLPAMLQRSSLRWALRFAIVASTLISYHYVYHQSLAHPHGYGSLVIEYDNMPYAHITLDGQVVDRKTPRLRMGSHQGKLIDQQKKLVRDFRVTILPEQETRVELTSD